MRLHLIVEGHVNEVSSHFSNIEINLWTQFQNNNCSVHTLYTQNVTLHRYINT